MECMTVIEPFYCNHCVPICVVSISFTFIDCEKSIYIYIIKYIYKPR